MNAVRPALAAFALLMLLAAVPPARADVRAEITPFVGYRMSGGFDVERADGTGTESVDVEDSSAWGIDVGIYATPDAFYEFLYSTQTTNLDSRNPAVAGVDVTTEYFQLGGTAFFPGEQWAVPYLSLTVGATRYVTPLREGGSLPGLVEADDDGLYVLKFSGAGQGVRALMAEVLAGELARALELPVPELVLMDLDPALGRAEPDLEIKELIDRSPGINLGVDFLPGALPRGPPQEHR